MAEGAERLAGDLPRAAALAWMALAGAGVPSAVLLLRRRGGPRDPVPRGSAPSHPGGIAAAGLAVVGGQVVRVALAGDAEGAGVADLVGWVTVGHVVGVGLGLALLGLWEVPIRGRPAPVLRAAAAGVLTGLAFLPAAFLLAMALLVVSLVTGWRPEPQRMVAYLRDGGSADVAAIAVLAVLVAPVAEEWIFRGFLHRGLRAIASPGKAMLISAAAFSLVHMEPGNPIALPATFLLGLALADLAERTGGLAAPMAMHACYNGAQVAVMLVARGAGGPPGGG